MRKHTGRYFPDKKSPCGASTLFTMKTIVYISFLILAIALGGCSATDKEKERGRDLLEVARNNYMTGDYVESMKSLHEYIIGAESGEIKTEPQTDIQIYKFLGNIHFIYGDYPGAIKNYELALLKGAGKDNSTEKLKILYNLGLTSNIMGDSIKTLDYVKEIEETKDADPGLKNYFRTVAKAYYEINFGSRAKGIALLQRSLQIVEESKLENYLKFTPYSALSSWYEENGRYSEALKVLAEYEKALARTPEAPASLKDCMRGYMSVYTKLGNREKADYYQRRYLNVSDSLMDQNRFARANERFRRHYVDESTSKASALNSILTVQHIGLLIGAIVIAALIFRIVSRRKQRDVPRLTASIIPQAAPAIATIDQPILSPSAPERKDKEQEKSKVSTGKHEQLYRELCSILDDSRYYADPDFSIEKLATQLNSNVKYVSQAVHENSGTNFRTFLNNRRIEAAIEILDREGGKVSILEVSRRVGFASQSAFIAAFRRVTGVTPSRYRQVAAAN